MLGFESWAGHTKKIASDLGLGGGFVRDFGLLHHLQLSSHDDDRNSKFLHVLVHRNTLSLGSDELFIQVTYRDEKTTV